MLSTDPLEASLQSIVRSWLDSVAVDSRPQALAEGLTDTDFDEMLRRNRDWRPDDYGEVWRQWRDAKNGLSEEELASLWKARWRILGPLFDECIGVLRMQHAAQAQRKFELNQPAEIRALRSKVQKLESSSGVQNRQFVNLAYLVVLTAIVGIVGLAVWSGWSQVPEVTVEFNVGEIIGGVLVGAGAITAGAAYALRSTTPSGESNPR